jgi:hypothetical protein
MAVITGDGLVGRVYEVGLNYAKYFPSSIPQRGRLPDRAHEGQRRHARRDHVLVHDVECYMYYLPAVNDVIPATPSSTSGVDTLFSKGNHRGHRHAGIAPNGQLRSVIVVEPSVDFQHIEEVLVLRTVVETYQEENLPVVPTPTPRPPSRRRRSYARSRRHVHAAGGRRRDLPEGDAHTVRTGRNGCQRYRPGGETVAPTPTPNPDSMRPRTAGRRLKHVGGHEICSGEFYRSAGISGGAAGSSCSRF